MLLTGKEAASFEVLERGSVRYAGTVAFKRFGRQFLPGLPSTATQPLGRRHLAFPN